MYQMKQETSQINQMEKPKFRVRFLISTPFGVNSGGTTAHCESVIQQIKIQGHEIKQLEFDNHNIDFEVLLVFSFSYHNPDMLEKYKQKGIIIALIPIFDRTKPKWSFKIYQLFENTPIRTLYNQRKRILESADFVLANCSSEKQDLIDCYNVQENKIHILKLGINNQFIELDRQIEPSLFEQKYNIKDFIIYSSAEINQRKNQVAVVKAIEDTDLKVVLTGGDKILVPNFEQIIGKNPNILLLPKISIEELISAYKSARVSVSLSSSETAGLALLESAYFGCNLVVSRIPAFVEYLTPIANFVDLPINTNELKRKLIEATAQPKTQNTLQNQQEFILNNNSWTKYTKNLLDLIATKI
jgi:glycosyltransferase involved in cell wall biosynthesis